MRSQVKDLIEQGNNLFSKRGGLLSHWQDVALHFYPERADFTTSIAPGNELASHLMTGRPVLARRDLANSFSAMLRPRSKPWFTAKTDNEKVNEDNTARKWLEWVTGVQRNHTYNDDAKFVRATKQGDNDFAAFGQCVIEVRPNRALNGLLFLPWHLRDVVWCEDAELNIERVDRNWKLEAAQLKRIFKNVHKSVETAAEKDPYKEIKCRHIVIPSDNYTYQTGDTNRRKLPFVSIYIDIENEFILEETPAHSIPYVIPRWVAMPGTQYAISPAVMVALPDARLIQQMTLTLLEAGQKIVDPSWVAQSDGVIQGGVNVGAGQITWIDSQYDERLGEALRQLPIDGKGLQWGTDREDRIVTLIQQAFFLDQVRVPEISGDMTATEARIRYEDYIRRALPLFEPLEVEYNGGLCEKSFEVLMRLGAFGSPFDMPPILRGRDVKFKFESPLQQATERAKSQAFLEAGNLLSMVLPIDPGARHVLNISTGLRDALTGVGAPADWIASEEYEAHMREQDAKQQAEQQALQTVSAGASATNDIGKALQGMQAAGAM